MRHLLAACAVWTAAVTACPAHESDAAARRIQFPPLADGRQVLAVDLHTHSVFSDGLVWPDIRVEEARRDALAAFAVTEHIEAQNHAADIPHPDRNRPFDLAREAASAGAGGRTPLMVINGVEITRPMPHGHINAVFVSDANAYRDGDVHAQLRTARAEGAFIFWNHPFFHGQVPDAIARMDDFHQQAIGDGLIDGVEVANGLDLSDEALQIALDNDLAILGTSDIHGLVDWDHDTANGGHRTVTLVLAESPTETELKAALQARRTVAFYNGGLVGRPSEVEAILRAALQLELRPPLAGTLVVPVRLVNGAPMEMLVEAVGPEGIYDEARVFRIPARGAFDLILTRVSDPARPELTLKVLNSHTAPGEHLTLTLRTPAQ